jgi:hypothetical protein
MRLIQFGQILNFDSQRVPSAASLANTTVLRQVQQLSPPPLMLLVVSDAADWLWSKSHAWHRLNKNGRRRVFFQKKLTNKLWKQKLVIPSTMRSVLFHKCFSMGLRSRTNFRALAAAASPVFVCQACGSPHPKWTGITPAPTAPHQSY